MDYPRDLGQDFEPFDPIEVSKETERIVTDGRRRKYNLFRLEPFYGQTATARGVGCNLRCGFCWINPSRDYPEDYGAFFSPEEVYDRLIEISSNEYGRAVLSEGVRVSGCEPTIGREHLFSFIDICKSKCDFRWFLLETNGMLLGYDESYDRDLSEFGDYLWIRLSFKAGTPETFQRKTGAKADFFYLPFRALEYFGKYGIRYSLASMSKDPALMPPEERLSLLRLLSLHGIENLGLLEEERADPFGITKTRLCRSGLVSAPDKVGKQVYEPLAESILRTERRIDRNPKPLFDAIEFETKPSPCLGCKRKIPWHGHGVRDDLDEGLMF